MGWSGPRTRKGRRKPKWWSNQRVVGSSPTSPTNPQQKNPGGNAGVFSCIADWPLFGRAWPINCGTMSDASERTSFELRRLADYSEESIIKEIQRVADLVPDGALTASAFLGHSRVNMGAVRRRFKTWPDALRAAGLSHRSSDVVRTRGAHPSARMSNDDILKSLRELAARLGKEELTINDVRMHTLFAGDTLRKRWGTSRAAFEAAGVGSVGIGRRYTDDECFDNLLTVWTNYGRPPMHREMGLLPSKVGGKAYRNRFGTWNKALAAFVDRVNQEPEEFASEETAVPTSASVVTRPADDRRDISLGLRFRVLHRDFFKCVLCGDHPARNPECVLHVDHIVPWSKGGKTRDDNLRSLCATCNIGRGNRYTE